LEAEDIVEYVGELTSFSVPVVIDHMARFKVSDGLKQKAFQLILDFVRNENFWIKISGAERLSNTSYPFDDIVPFAQSLIEVAPNRIIWGTDWPHPNIVGQMPNDGELVDMLESYAPDKITREKIIVENPAELYGFDK
jgi:predicted TIM-barrel fold metal-dependent hydrolase